MGKGDTPRPTNKEKFDEGFERIFGDSKRFPKLWEAAPKYTGGDKPDSGQVANEQEPVGQPDPKAEETVAGTRRLTEAEWCEFYSQGEPRDLYCDKCGRGTEL